MYLLEETPEAQVMRQNVIRLLQSNEKVNIELAFQLIESGGMHEEISYFLQNKYEEERFGTEYLKNYHILLMPFVTNIGESDYYGIESRGLHDELRLCKNLKVFSLPFGSNVSHLPDWVGEWKHLEYFNMPYSWLVYLPDSVGNWVSLNSINITNKLLCLPESVGNWENLIHLNLQNNQLTSLPASAKNWVNLKTIDISGNSIPNLPAQLQKRYEIRNDWQELLAQINGT